jgi:hypothetical protein
MRERGVCVESGCGRAVSVRAHWLCYAHRRERGRAFLARLARLSPASEGATVSEASVLGELVFSFPVSCASVDHFLGHFYAVTRCWTKKAPCRDVLKQHALLGKVRVGASMSRADVAEFVTRFAAFTVSHARAYGWTRLVDTCADRVAEWYPCLLVPGPLDEIHVIERMLVCLPPRVRPWIAFADFARALRSVLPHDSIECVFLHYIGLIRSRAFDASAGGLRFIMS